MEKRELYDKFEELSQNLMSMLAEVEAIKAKRFMMMASIFVQIFMANVVIIMKPVASVRNCCTEIKDAGSKEF